MRPNPQFPEESTFTEEIHNGKLNVFAVLTSEKEIISNKNSGS